MSCARRPSRLLGLAFLLLLVRAQPARAAIAFVDWGNNSSCGNSATCAASNVLFTNGNAMCVGVYSPDTNWTVTGVADNGSSSYSLQASATNGTNRLEAWCTLALSGSPSSVTATLSAIPTSTTWKIIVLTYSGVVALGHTAMSTGSSLNCSVAITTQDANNYLAGFCANNNTVFGTTTSGTSRKTDTGLAGGDTTTASPGTITYALDVSPSQVWMGAAVELRTVAGGGGLVCTPTISTLGVGRCG